VSDPREPVDTPEPSGEEDLDLENVTLDELDPEPPEEVVDETEAEEPEPTQTRTRSNDTIRSLRARAQSAERKIDEFQRRLDEQQMQPRVQQPQVDPLLLQQRQREEEAQVQQLPYEQQIAYWRNRDQQENNRRFAQLQLQSFDQFDTANFNQLKRSEPAAARLAPEVERVLQQQRAQGNYSFSRENIYDYLLGQETRRRATQQAGRQRTAGAGRVARQTTAPASGRGDMARAPGNGRAADADERLLRSITAEDI
jgi:hypothetical protein